MADPAMAAARSVDALTDEPLTGLPMTEVRELRLRVAELEAEVARARRHVCPVIYASSTNRVIGAGW